MEVVIDRSQYEIERGKPMPSKNHGFLQFKIGNLIDRKYIDQFQFLSELSLIINDVNEKIPDLAIYRTEDFDWDFDNDETKVQQMPLCVVEITSPSQAITELIIKSRTYFDAGVKSYWLVIPDLKSVYVFSDKGEYEVFAKKDILKDTVLDIELDLGQLFKTKKK